MALLGKLLSEAAIARNGNDSPAACEVHETARNGYISATPESPIAQQATPTQHVETRMPIDTS